MSNLKDIKTARHNLQAAWKTERAVNNLTAVAILNEAIDVADLSIKVIAELEQKVRELEKDRAFYKCCALSGETPYEGSEPSARITPPQEGKENES